MKQIATKKFYNDSIYKCQYINVQKQQDKNVQKLQYSIIEPIGGKHDTRSKHKQQFKYTNIGGFS